MNIKLEQHGFSWIVIVNGQKVPMPKSCLTAEHALGEAIKANPAIFGVDSLEIDESNGYKDKNRGTITATVREL